MCYSIFKTVFLFVGAVIGAGFATGSEIMLYFGDSDIWSVILSGIIIGILAIIYGLFGKITDRYRWVDKVQKAVILVCTLVTYIIVLAGAEEIINFTFKVKYFGVITGILVAILLLYDMRIIKLLNAIIVPIIAIMMLVLVCKSGDITSGQFTVDRSILYACMNMMLGGYIMTQEGKQYTTKQLLFCGSMIAVIMSILMVFCYMVAINGRTLSMPLYEVAKHVGLGGSAGVIIYLAIFTTLIGSARMIGDILVEIGLSPRLVAVFFALLSCSSLRVDFARMVAVCYPPTGWIGLGYLAVVMWLLIVEIWHYIQERKWNR